MPTTLEIVAKVGDPSTRDATFLRLPELPVEHVESLGIDERLTILLWFQLNRVRVTANPGITDAPPSNAESTHQAPSTKKPTHKAEPSRPLTNPFPDSLVARLDSLWIKEVGDIDQLQWSLLRGRGTNSRHLQCVLPTKLDKLRASMLRPKSLSEKQRIEIARNGADSTLDMSCGDLSPKVRNALAERDFLPLEIEERLALDVAPLVRATIASRPRLSSSTMLTIALADDERSKTRMAQRPDIDTYSASIMALDARSSVAVLAALIRNQAVPNSVIAQVRIALSLRKTATPSTKIVGELARRAEAN